MQNEATFFIMGPAHHHLYYMVPFIRATANKELCVIHTSESYNEMLKKEYPDLNIVTFSGDDKRLIDYFNSFKIIFLSNAYVLFEDHIRKCISQDKVIVNIQHFAPVKFVDDISFILGNYLWDITVTAGRKDVDLLVRHGLSKLEEEDYTNPQWLKVYEKKLQVILGGNARMKGYLANRLNRESVFSLYPKFDPAKKTILYMPTFSYNIDRSKSDYCSIPLFVKFLEQMKSPRDFNFIFKLHPGLTYEKEMTKSLLLAAQKRGIKIQLDFFGPDYFHYMEIADMLVTDRTSASFDFFYFNKPVLFLDHNDACPSPPEFDDITNSYWSYQFGTIVSNSNVRDIDSIIAESLAEDTFGAARERCLEYIFANDFTVEEILEEIREHPKLK
ncbi:MAG: hypothetical protein GY757_39440 [bacterium]|nr:hypothetical protein [bacterium]